MNKKGNIVDVMLIMLAIIAVMAIGVAVYAKFIWDGGKEKGPTNSNNGNQKPVVEQKPNPTNERHVYEMHMYDSTFNHTEEVKAIYDGNGQLKSLAYYRLYEGFKAPNEKPYGTYNMEYDVDLSYPGVEAKNIYDEKGLTVYYAFTDESVRRGYLDDEDAMSPIVRLYEEVSNEIKMKRIIEQNLSDMKDNEEVDFECNDKYYFVIDGVRTCW